MKRALPLALLLCGSIGARQGLPARSTADQYAAQGSIPGAVVAAAVISQGQVRNEFATTLAPHYQVLEIAFYPDKGGSVDVSVMDFALRVDGRFIRPAAPRSIAALNQKRGARSRDIVLWPSVGVSTGTWGTGANVGVGMGRGGRGPASTDQDRRVMEAELEDRALQDGASSTSVAGYLYFPVGETKARSAELVYQHGGGETTLVLELPHEK